MKTNPHPARRAAWLLLAAPAFLATPAFAQEAQTAPPPVSVTVPDAAPAPAPTVTQAAPPAASNATGTESKTVLSPGAQAALEEGKARTAPARPAARAAAPRQVTRATTAPRAAPVAPAPAPVAETSTPAPEPAPAPVAAAPIAPQPVAEPAAPVADTTATDTTTTDTAATTRAPVWPWIAAAILLIVAGIGFFAWRRSRAGAFDGQYEPEADYYSEVAQPERPLTVDPAPATFAAAAPLAAAAPVAPAVATPAVEPVAVASEDATVTDAEAEEVAALTDASAPVRDRPWLEFAMRPVRAGTNADEAMVEIELTVANSGTRSAEDVRVSTFMLTDVHASEIERLMVAPPADAAVEPVTIAPGEGTRIDATLAALKTDLGGEGGFTPVVVADARYRLPDGSEGRTSASFLVGVSDEGGDTLIPFDLSDRVMREDIEARLHGEPQHA